MTTTATIDASGTSAAAVAMMKEDARDGGRVEDEAVIAISGVATLYSLPAEPEAKQVRQYSFCVRKVISQ